MAAPELRGDSVNLAIYGDPADALDFLAASLERYAQGGWALYYDFCGSWPHVLRRLAAPLTRRVRAVDGLAFCAQLGLPPLPPLFSTPSCVISDSLRAPVLSMARGLMLREVPLFTLFYLVLLSELALQLKAPVLLCEYELGAYGRWLINQLALKRLGVHVIEL